MTSRQVEAYYRSEHRGIPVLLEDPGDVDALIDALLAGGRFDNAAALYSLDRPLMPTGFPDHELVVGVDGNLEVGALSFMDDGNFFSFDPTRGRGEVSCYVCRGEVSYYVSGGEREFPERSAIPIALVRQAVKEFLSSGGVRPTCIQWQEQGSDAEGSVPSAGPIRR
jgi:hypothetical protein